MSYNENNTIWQLASHHKDTVVLIVLSTETLLTTTAHRGQKRHCTRTEWTGNELDTRKGKNEEYTLIYICTYKQTQSANECGKWKERLLGREMQIMRKVICSCERDGRDAKDCKHMYISTDRLKLSLLLVELVFRNLDNKCHCATTNHWNYLHVYLIMESVAGGSVASQIGSPRSVALPNAFPSSFLQLTSSALSL
ncbi:hypothetical protein CBL_03938 [Carabus blaptoides fortunei]